MAGDWIKMRGNLWDDPRVSKLCDMTDRGEAEVIGALYWLWATADQHTENGIMPGLTLRQIDRKTGVQGFGAALLAIGWLADHPEGVRIVKFEEHNGSSAKKRAITAKRVAVHRSSNADVTHGALQDEHGSVTGALAREREREREEGKPNNPDGLFVDSDADDLSHGRQKSGSTDAQTSAKPSCPHQEILAAYHELLPANPSIRDWTPARAAHLRARWAEDQKRQTLDWWRRFFAYIADSAFLTGRSTGKTGKPFTPGLDWIVKAENFAKIREGRFHDSEAA